LLTVKIFIFRIFIFREMLFMQLFGRVWLIHLSHRSKKIAYILLKFSKFNKPPYTVLSKTSLNFFVYNTKIKELTKLSKKFPEFYFKFATTDLLLERESKDKQCSGKVCCLYYFTLISMLFLIHFFQMSLVYLAACQMYNKEMYWKTTVIPESKIFLRLNCFC
jgi:hypothetical protein